MKIDEDFRYRVLETLREIPKGKVMSYGQIAAYIGYRKNARWVGRLLRYAGRYGEYPCHRVVNAQGRTAPFWPEQQSLLQEEGVVFKADGKVDMKIYQWREDE